jgi:transcriptional regulator with XRE-family HTH domain
MAKRQRTLTDADRRAAAKVRGLWAEYQKKNPGVSQELAASRAGMGQSAFSQFLRGTVPMRVAPVLKFAKLFSVDPTEIRPDITALAYSAAREVDTPHAAQPAATYGGVSQEALAIARAFDALQPQSREFVREQVFIYTMIDKSFPWLRRGRPVGTSYEQFEQWHKENIALAMKKGSTTTTAPEKRKREKAR